MSVRTLSFLVVVALVAHSSDLNAQTSPQTAPGSQNNQQPPPDQPPVFATTVTVIEAAPLQGLDLPLEKIPAPVQTASGQDLERSGALDLSAFLMRRFNGVFANEIQSNPFQPDINYRYTASPPSARRRTLRAWTRPPQPAVGDVVTDLIPSPSRRRR
jgi:hypothetical protein